jgi:hypothetical protein
MNRSRKAVLPTAPSPRSVILQTDPLSNKNSPGTTPYRVARINDVNFSTASAIEKQTVTKWQKKVLSLHYGVNQSQ